MGFFWGGVDPNIYDVTFHTSGTNYSYTNHYAPGDFQTSDEQVAIGPYVELRYAAIQSDKLDVNVVFGYSWVGADLASGTGISATNTIIENRNQQRFAYSYDFIQIPGLIQSSSFPFCV